MFYVMHLVSIALRHNVQELDIELEKIFIVVFFVYLQDTDLTNVWYALYPKTSHYNLFSNLTILVIRRATFLDNRLT